MKFCVRLEVLILAKILLLNSGLKHTQTFIDYARKAKRILNLNDPETNSLIKNHKQKIAKALNKPK